MGDSVDLHTGSLSFSHIDISLKGNSDLDVSLRRTQSQGQRFHESVDAEFGDWALLVPRVEAVLGENSNWQDVAEQRCSAASFPAETMESPVWEPGSYFVDDWVTKNFNLTEYSDGIKLTTPTQGTQQVLKAMGGADYHRPDGAEWTTKSGWYLDCIPLGNNEGFRAVSPEGHIHTFDKLIVGRANDLNFHDIEVFIMTT